MCKVKYLWINGKYKYRKSGIVEELSVLGGQDEKVTDMRIYLDSSYKMWFIVYQREDSEARGAGKWDSRMTYESEQRKQSKFRKLPVAQNSCEWHVQGQG